MLTDMICLSVFNTELAVLVRTRVLRRCGTGRSQSRAE